MNRMENDYGIGITNRYLMFLDNEDDPHETLKISESVDKDPNKKKVAVKSGAEKENRLIKDGDQKSTVKSGLKGIRDSNDKTSKGNSGAGGDNVGRNNRQNNMTSRGQGGQEGRNNNNNNKGFGEPLAKKRDPDDRYNNRRNRDDGGRYNDIRGEPEFGRFNDGPRRFGGGGGGRQFQDGDRGMRGGNRNGPRDGPRGEGGRGGPRDGGAFSSRGGDRGGGGGMRKREFDRQSGSDKSGVKQVDKRDGGGSRNWGTFKDDIDHLNAAEDSMEDRADKDEPRENGPGGESDGVGCEKKEGEIDEEKEAEKKEMTLDQWKALQAGSRQKPIYNTRKAGEGEDMSQWSKLTLKKKEKVEASEEEEEEEVDVHQRGGGKVKKVIELNFKFNDPPGGRGKSDRDRGGDRGGGGRGFRGGDRDGRRDGDRDQRRDGDRRDGGDRRNDGDRRDGGDRRNDGGDRDRRGDGGPQQRRDDRGGDRGGFRGGDEGGRRNDGGDRDGRGGQGGGRFGDRDRGGPRGGGGRGGPRGEGRDKPVKQAAPNYDDVNDFPSLG